MITLTICIVVYIITIIFSFKWVQKVYFHPHGKWYGRENKICFIDYFMVFCPFGNLFLIFDNWEHRIYRKKSIFYTNKYEND